MKYASVLPPNMDVPELDPPKRDPDVDVDPPKIDAGAVVVVAAAGDPPNIDPEY